MPAPTTTAPKLPQVIVLVPKEMDEEGLKKVNAKIMKARADLVLDHTPLISNIILRCPLEVAYWCPTACTDGSTIWYNPWFIQDLPSEHVLYVFAHEAVHIINKHPFRRGDRDLYRWNIACDQATNYMLDAMLGIAGPPDRVPGVADRSAEALYEELEPEDFPRPDGGCGGSGSGTGDPGDQPGGAGQTGQDDGPDAPDPGKYGGIIDPQKEDGVGKDGPTKQSRILPGSADWHNREAEVDVGIQSALETAKACGNVPAGMERIIGKVTEATVPWTHYLSKLVGRLARHDYNWSVPDRRYWSDDIYAPSLFSPTMEQVVVGIDTSGSMSDQDIGECVSELFGILGAYTARGIQPNVDVIWCDTNPVHQKLTSVGDLLKPEGFGGTSFAPVFDFIRQEGWNPQLIVYLTDGICYDFGDPPDQPVAWVITRRGDKDFQPPFGQVLHVAPDRP